MTTGSQLFMIVIVVFFCVCVVKQGEVADTERVAIAARMVNIFEDVYPDRIPRFVTELLHNIRLPGSMVRQVGECFYVFGLSNHESFPLPFIKHSPQ